MRRFIQAVAIAGMMLPGVAFAHDGDEPATGGQGSAPEQAGSGGNGGTSGDRTDLAGTQAATAAQSLLPFRGSILILDQSVTPETIFPGSQLSPIPSYQWWISLRPRWYLTPDLQVRVREDLTTEWFNGGAETTRTREPQWGDLWTEMVYTGLPTFLGIKTAVGIRAVWPISLASRMRGTYVALGATAGISRTFEHLPGTGDLTVGLSFAGSHAFTATNATGNILGGGNYGCGAADFVTPTVCDNYGGPMNANFNLLSIFTLGYNTPLKGLAINFMYLLSNSWVYAPTQTTIYSNMGDPNGYTVPYAADANRMRQLEWFLVSLDYEVNRVVSLSLGYYVYRPVLDPDSHYGNPFYSPGGNTRIFFTGTIALDGLWQTITGAPTPSASAHASAAPSRRRTSINDTARALREAQVANGMFF